MRRGREGQGGGGGGGGGVRESRRRREQDREREAFPDPVHNCYSLLIEFDALAALRHAEILLLCVGSP